MQKEAENCTRFESWHYIPLYDWVLCTVCGLQVTKLGYILGNLFLSLFTEGFCRTKDGEGEDGANNFEDDAKGTGMGEGEGKKDVSEQIEDEEQLMGDSDKVQHDTLIMSYQLKCAFHLLMKGDFVLRNH